MNATLTLEAKRALRRLRTVVRSLEDKGDLSVFGQLHVSPYMRASDEWASTRARWRAHARLTDAKAAVSRSGLDADAYVRSYRSTI
jgi:hypothetical protein